MNPTEIEFALRDLVAKPYEAQTFAFDLIGLLNASKMTIGRLRSGATNKAKRPGDLLWQSRLFFRLVEPGQDVGDAAAAMAADPLAAKNKPRFIIATDGKLVHMRDTKFDETEVVEFGRLHEKSDFLLPLAGYERRALVEEHPADIKAAKKLKKLYDAILAANPTWSSGHHTHELNLLMTRLLFCFYAEKTGIFTTPDVFSDAVTQHTYQDPGAVAPLLDRLFRVMNVEEKARPAGAPAVDARFPYVNGSLFAETLEIPTFDLTARRQLLECGDLDWTDINPDIFGSMIQTIAQDGTRSDLGMHYTSVPNIMKVLQPLFLDELNEAFEKVKDSAKKLDELLLRLSKIRVFDPACGSGNFLVIAYKALRELETRTLVRIGELQPNTPLRLSGISLQNFYGMDVVDFACETTKLSLWIAEHQTNSAFQKIFGQARPTLPLPKITKIRCANATRENWLSVCPPDEDGETFVCGNPPYHGTKYQTAREKDDLAFVFRSSTSTFKELDYVSAWFFKASGYIQESPSTSSAFVSTNSICQGAQVALLWPLVLKGGVDISFAHTSFRWSNNAAHNAGITCIIVGLAATNRQHRRLFTGEHELKTPHIGPYLIPSQTNQVVSKARKPLTSLPPMLFGNKASDGGHLILSPAEKARLLENHPNAARFLRRIYGSQEFINEIERWTVWICDRDVDMAEHIPPIADRLAAVAKSRRESPKVATKKLALYPYRYQECRVNTECLIVPHTFSERRRYVTVGALTDREIVLAPAFAIFRPPAYLLALLSSRLHWIWASAVGGHLENRIRYSNTLVYNTFPVPVLSTEQKTTLVDHTRAIVRARAQFPGKSIAWKYNPETMPDDLRQAHDENDAFLEEYVYGRRFTDDTQRLQLLFSMYERAKLRNAEQPLPISQSHEAIAK